MTFSVAHRRRVLWSCVSLVVVLAAAWALIRHAHADKPPTPASAPVLVSSVQVLSQTVPVYRTGVGTVTATQSVTVKARIDGQLDRVDFTEGQDVRAGQMLVRIDPRT